jgi:hypothetical protein
MTRPLLCCLTLGLAVMGCGGDDNEGASPAPGVASEYMVLAGFEEPTTPSPATIARGTARAVPDSLAAAVPSDSPLRDAQGDIDFNRIGVLRSHATPARARAVIVAIPGFGAGATSMRLLAERVVERSGGALEVWTIDRRENLLEDLRGMNAAEAAHDAEIAARYYRQGAELQGQRHHPVEPGDVVFMAEWGVDVLMRDVRTVVRRVHADLPRLPIYLAGHSTGAFFAPAYAAYDFDSGPGIDPGHADLAGLILLDGGPGAFPSRFEAPLVTERQYLDGGGVPLPPHLLAGGFRLAGLRKLRAPNLSDPGQYAFFNVAGLFSPAIVQDFELDAMRSQFAGGARSPTSSPAATNRFAFGARFDNDFAGVNPLRGSIGFAAGGAANVTQTSDLAGINPRGLFLPKDLSPVLQDWSDIDHVTPAEYTPLGDLAQAFYVGPTNAWEWYFPTRLVLDLLLVSNLDTSTLSADMRAELTRFGAPALDVTQNHAVALPVLAIRCEHGIVQSTKPNATAAEDEAILQPYFDSLATPRDALHVHTIPGYYHLDIVAAKDNPAVQLIADFATPQ